MELTHLRYFITVAEELHFGRAARKLHIAQPPLSQQIMRLEEELEVKLFNRTSRRVELTSAGKLFLTEAKAIIERADYASGKMRDIAAGSSGSLSLGFNESAINTFLPETIRNFREKHPEIKLILHELETAAQLEALQSAQIDLGVMRPFGHDLTQFSTQLLFQEHYVAAVPNNHKFIKDERHEIRLDELSSEKFIMFPREIHPSLYDHIVKCCEAVGFTPRIAQNAITKQTTLALIEAGLGIALVPESAKHHAADGISFIKLKSSLPPVNIMAVWRLTENSVIIRNFLEEITYHGRGIPDFLKINCELDNSASR